jgi:hypothetical protein
MGLKVTETFYCDHCRRIVSEVKDLICIRVTRQSFVQPTGVDDRYLAVCFGCFTENSAADMIPDFDYRGIHQATFDRCSVASGDMSFERQPIILSTLDC